MEFPMDLTMLAAVVLPSSANRLISLAPADLLIIIVYFLMVLGIGVYLKSYANTSNDFFMAGREMTAWVAGLSFLSANLGALELMGWAASTYQYGILAAHFYWIAAKLRDRRIFRPPMNFGGKASGRNICRKSWVARSRPKL